MERENMVKSVSRALDIISIVSMKKGGLGVTEIANQIDINKSSVYRILSTLVQYGYVEQDDDTGRYKLGYKLLEISSRLLDSIDLRTEAHPFLRELENATNEVIHLVVYDQDEVVYIEKLDGNEALRMHSKVGKRAPMHCTSVGKAILSQLPVHLVHDILDRKGLPAHTNQTIVDKETLLRELIEVRHKGFALDLQENEYGITCIAVPIFDHQGKVSAAVSISGPTMRMTDERLQELRPLMIQTGQQISARLGYVQ
ncbi:IclR family transcriptional regulator, KDG regulon repressor [Cytobacillus horneckiae]|uniref:Glycerol operon regulatory protein n=1 Tax=Cytobacillus horneckiae TaxID=549687 RepID=A0A2N0ZLL6_9BACI|nr:IclR family transcriptional regulator [Cytobacillus horneckiae]MBN6885834.1 IclR family transcriptional regulator [Cytobacillus horneckiae]MCM3177380.1 IclR family transcriptional regulator [Cytobacillus horneckiae]MEC1156056.1 IclR family transcriptional regulator [Cytobacillus horneckiae]MED2937416.1 IclR family transcriptional regulator [Cytobacillus horneckiae]PKG30400.1 IclR family transcriptional regulator [Cytobacillus horneckiae]